MPYEPSGPPCVREAARRYCGSEDHPAYEHVRRGVHRAYLRAKADGVQLKGSGWMDTLTKAADFAYKATKPYHEQIKSAVTSAVEKHVPGAGKYADMAMTAADNHMSGNKKKGSKSMVEQAKHAAKQHIDKAKQQAEQHVRQKVEEVKHVAQQHVDTAHKHIEHAKATVNQHVQHAQTTAHQHVAQAKEAVNNTASVAKQHMQAANQHIEAAKQKVNTTVQSSVSAAQNHVHKATQEAQNHIKTVAASAPPAVSGRFMGNVNGGDFDMGMKGGDFDDWFNHTVDSVKDHLKPIVHNIHEASRTANNVSGVADDYLQGQGFGGGSISEGCGFGGGSIEDCSGGSLYVQSAADKFSSLLYGGAHRTRYDEDGDGFGGGDFAPRHPPPMATVSPYGPPGADPSSWAPKIAMKKKLGQDRSSWAPMLTQGPSHESPPVHPAMAAPMQTFDTSGIHAHPMTADEHGGGWAGGDICTHMQPHHLGGHPHNDNDGDGDGHGFAGGELPGAKNVPPFPHMKWAGGDVPDATHPHWASQGHQFKLGPPSHNMNGNGMTVRPTSGVLSTRSFTGPVFTLQQINARLANAGKPPLTANQISMMNAERQQLGQPLLTGSGFDDDMYDPSYLALYGGVLPSRMKVPGLTLDQLNAKLAAAGKPPLTPDQIAKINARRQAAGVPLLSAAAATTGSGFSWYEGDLCGGDLGIPPPPTGDTVYGGSGDRDHYLGVDGWGPEGEAYALANHARLIGGGYEDADDVEDEDPTIFSDLVGGSYGFEEADLSGGLLEGTAPAGGIEPVRELPAGPYMPPSRSGEHQELMAAHWSSTPQRWNFPQGSQASLESIVQPPGPPNGILTYNFAGDAEPIAGMAGKTGRGPPKRVRYANPEDA